ncbi:MAG: cupin [Chloroflexi bacterium]|nr:cupin [Chloroflexota bacterium]
MKILDFGSQFAGGIDLYDSVNLRAMPIAKFAADVSVHCLYLDAGGVIGNHPTTNTQLFLVVDGAGWVRGESGAMQPIATGQAALWDAGEWHESRADQGMIAIVIEGKNIALSKSVAAMQE